MAQYGGDQKKYYHYTRAERAEQIKEDGVIKPSPHGYYGPKVYLTTVPPSESNRKIANEMVDSSKTAKPIAEGRTEAAIAITMDDSRVKKEPTAPSRDVHSYEGPLKLDTVDHWEVVNRKK